MQLIEGKKYLVWGQHEAEYIGDREMGVSGLQHRFKRTDGFGIVCVKPERLAIEVQEA